MWNHLIPKVSFPKSHFDTLECTLNEITILELISKNPSIKQQELADITGKSLVTIKRLMAESFLLPMGEDEDS